MIITQTFTVMEVRRRGAEWARMNPGCDGLAQQFFFGAVDEVR
jgi:hypothetical protein